MTKKKKWETEKQLRIVAVLYGCFVPRGDFYFEREREKKPTTFYSFFILFCTSQFISLCHILFNVSHNFSVDSLFLHLTLSRSAHPLSQTQLAILEEYLLML